MNYHEFIPSRKMRLNFSKIIESMLVKKQKFIILEVNKKHGYFWSHFLMAIASKKSIYYF